MLASWLSAPCHPVVIVVDFADRNLRAQYRAIRKSIDRFVERETDGTLPLPSSQGVVQGWVDSTKLALLILFTAAVVATFCDYK